MSFVGDESGTLVIVILKNDGRRDMVEELF